MDKFQMRANGSIDRPDLRLFGAQGAHAARNVGRQQIRRARIRRNRNQIQQHGNQSGGHGNPFPAGRHPSGNAHPEQSQHGNSHVTRIVARDEKPEQPARQTPADKQKQPSPALLPAQRRMARMTPAMANTKSTGPTAITTGTACLTAPTAEGTAKNSTSLSRVGRCTSADHPQGLRRQ